MLDKVQEFALLRARGYQSNGFSKYRKRAWAQKESGAYMFIKKRPKDTCSKCILFQADLLLIMLSPFCSPTECLISTMRSFVSQQVK